MTGGFVARDHEERMLWQIYDITKEDRSWEPSDTWLSKATVVL